MRLFVRVVTGMTLVLGSVSAASGQDFASSFDQLRTITKPRQVLFVIDREGNETRGRLESVADGTLTLAGRDGPRRFGADEIIAVRTPGNDSVLNGALIGGAVEAGTVAIVFLSCDGYCSGAGAALVGNFVIGAGIGALVDAFIQTPRDIYRVGKRHVDVKPIVSGTKQGAQVVLRW